MSVKAEDVSTSSTPEGASVDAVSQIADLFLDETDESKDKDDEETQLDESTLDKDEESKEAAEDEEGVEDEPEIVAESDDDTWEGVLGVDEGSLSFDDDGNINGFITKVGGESTTVGAKDLIAGYQNNKVNTQKAQALGEERRAFNEEKEQSAGVYASKLASVEALSKHFEKQLISEFDGVDWPALRVSDPAEYAALSQDYSRKAGELQRIQEAINKDKETQHGEFAKQNNEAAQNYMKEQFDLMIEKNPEWKDEPTRTTARASFKAFVIEQYGFNDKEFESVFDARLIELIKDAKKYREGATVAKTKRKKLVPKFQKSRGKIKKSVSKLDKLTAASKKASGQQKRDLQTSAVAELLTGNI